MLTLADEPLHHINMYGYSLAFEWLPCPVPHQLRAKQLIIIKLFVFCIECIRWRPISMGFKWFKLENIPQGCPKYQFDILNI